MEKVDSATYTLPLFEGYPLKDNLTEGELTVTKWDIRGKKPSLTVRHRKDGKTQTTEKFIITDEDEKVCVRKHDHEPAISISQAVYLFGYEISGLYDQKNKVTTDMQTLEQFKNIASNLSNEKDDPLLSGTVKHFLGRVDTLMRIVGMRLQVSDDQWESVLEEIVTNLSEDIEELPTDVFLSEIQGRIDIEDESSIPEITRKAKKPVQDFYNHVSDEDLMNEFDVIAGGAESSGRANKAMFVRTELRTVNGETKIYVTFFIQGRVGRYTFNVVGDADNRVCVYERKMKKDTPPSEIYWYLTSELGFEVKNAMVVSDEDSLPEQFAQMTVVLDQMKEDYMEMNIHPTFAAEAANWAGDISNVLVYRSVLGEERYNTVLKTIADNISGVDSPDAFANVRDGKAMRKLINSVFVAAPPEMTITLRDRMEEIVPDEVNRKVNRAMDGMES